MSKTKNYLNYSIYRTPNRPFWFASVQTKSGRYRFSTKIEATDRNKDRALEIAKAKFDEELDRSLGKITKRRLTLTQAFGTYLKYEQHKFSTGWNRTVNSAIDSFAQSFGKNVAFDQLTTASLTGYCLEKKHLSNASKNRHVAVFRRTVNFLKDMDFATPTIRFNTLKLPEPDNRMAEISREDFAKLYKKLPEHLKPIVLFAILTGLRKSNILSLDWKQVNLFKGIIQVSVKSKRPGGKLITVPISEPLKELLISLEPQKEGHVFTYQGKPIKDVKKAFKTARHEWIEGKRVCWLLDFRFHDLRHSFACWFINEGGSLKEIQDALGHSDPRTTQKYARMKIETLKNSLNKVTAFAQIGQRTKVKK
jgi:integrase